MKIKKKLIASAMIVAMMMGTATTALAGQWQQNSKGWWWQEDNGAYPKSQWQWIDGNKDGIAECYYFDNSGYMLSEPVTANTSNDTVTNSQAPATDVYSGTYAYNIGTYSFSMKIVYDPATKTLTDTEWLPGFGGVTDTYHYAGVNEMGYIVFKCTSSNRTAISSDSYIYFSAPGVMVVETENGYENVKKQ